MTGRRMQKFTKGSTHVLAKIALSQLFSKSDGRACGSPVADPKSGLSAGEIPAAILVKLEVIFVNTK